MNRQVLIVVLLCFGAAFSAGCKRVTLAAEFPDFGEVDSIRIENSWIGYGGPDSPRIREYTLERDGGSFAGVARFIDGRDDELGRDSLEEIAIPSETIRSFLKKLADSPLKEGKYKPRIDHTDDYPSTSISLATKNGTAVIFSQSQGAGSVPWGMSFKGRSFVIDSDIPAVALKELEPYLKRKTPVGPKAANADISEISLQNGGGQLVYWYRIVFRRDGTAEYEGDVGPERRGEPKSFDSKTAERVRFRGRIAAEEFAYLAGVVEQNGFFSLKDHYAGVSGAPQTTTGVVRAGSRKEVSNQLDRGGDKLAEIERAIARAADQIKWEKD